MHIISVNLETSFNKLSIAKKLAEITIYLITRYLSNKYKIM